ncbi:MAG TPA: Hsp20/alpha crystallin family protein [Solirubrobacteraceae bacterium]
MPTERDLFANFERMRREMDELFGDVGGWFSGRSQTGFSPRVDVYYCGEPPKAIVKVDLAGVSLDSVGLEVVGRDLVITGERPIQETEGRVYQQVEIEAGPFRRMVELNADVVAEDAKATYDDGILRVELPLRVRSPSSRNVPIETND